MSIINFCATYNVSIGPEVERKLLAQKYPSDASVFSVVFPDVDIFCARQEEMKKKWAETYPISIPELEAFRDAVGALLEGEMDVEKRHAFWMAEWQRCFPGSDMTYDEYLQAKSKFGQRFVFSHSEMLHAIQNLIYAINANKRAKLQGMD